MKRWHKHLPFRELTIPVKMLRGKLANVRKHITPFRELTIPHGSLRMIDGVPLVRVRGTHREMGRALGTLVGVQAAETFHSYMQCFAPDFAGDLKLARKMEPHLPDWFKDEILGFSETCELTYEQMLVGQCFLDIHKVAACSTIAAHDGASATGEMLIGRNLDFPSLDIAHEANMVVVYEPGGTPASDSPQSYAGVTWPGFLGIITGINDSGLALSMMLVYGQHKHEHLNGQPFPLVFRRLLRECGNVREADALLRDKPFCTATNLILGDASRTAARFQLHPKYPVVEYTTPQQPATACTNHYLDRKLKGLAFTWFSSILRYQRLQSRIKRGFKWDIPAIKKALQATAIPTINLQRAILRPEKRSMEVSFERNGKSPGRWVEMPGDVLFPHLRGMNEGAVVRESSMAADVYSG